MKRASHPHDLKRAVRGHWELEPCGTRYRASEAAEGFEDIRRHRAKLEPWIQAFQDVAAHRGRDVLEIGTGAGSDFVNWHMAGVDAVGIDLTRAGVETTRAHCIAAGRDAGRIRLAQADAERLPFRDASFDHVYSYGVLHHSPDTPAALREARRVLRPGGTLRIMIYHHPSWTAVYLWLYHALLRGRPFRGLKRVVFEHLESPGTKCYTRREARELMARAGFTDIAIALRLGPGDLLRIMPSERYRSRFVRIAFALLPRPLLRMFGNGMGLILMIKAENSEQ